ncbi:MAG: type IV pilus assembly protein PilM [Actinomycetota bacterium]|nr:type IV pilus assembly protein PilM [Actinomycetota bacterium]
MAKGRIGLDIGSTAVRAVELTGSDPPTVVKAAQVPLPAGAVENGEVKDPEVVTEALRELWERGGFKAKRVYMGVGNQRVVVREIALPYLPEKELRASLGFQVQEFIPMAVDEAVLDYDPIGEFDQDDRKMLRMLLVAAQRQMVDTVVAAATGAKLEPVGLDLVPFAMVRSVGTTGVGMDLEDEGDEAVIDIGAHVTNIVVHARGTVRFVRILPSGGRDITLAIARGIGVDDEVAERLKRGEEVELESSQPDAPQADDGDDAAHPDAAGEGDDEAGDRGADSVSEPLDLSRVREIAMQRAASFVDEIRSSLEFYTAQAQGARIARVLVTGGGSKLEGFLELLRQRIPVEVEAGQVFHHARSQLSLSDEALAEAEPVLAVAVGLAIPGRNA